MEQSRNVAQNKRDSSIGPVRCRPIADWDEGDERAQGTYLTCYQSDRAKFGQVRDEKYSLPAKPRCDLESTDT